MKKLIGALILIALSVALVSLLNQNNGYALLGFGQWTVEGSLATFILFDLALFVMLYLAIRSLVGVWSVPERWQKWKKGRQKQRSQNSLTNGLLDMAAGKWKSAEQKLVKYADVAEKPILNYLSAARIAQERGAYAKRDSYLKLAQESMPSEDLAVSLTQAELQLSNNQTELALATLMHLREIAPKHGYVLKLLTGLYLKLEDWSALKKLLPEISKSDAISREELNEIEMKVYLGLMGQATVDEESDELNNLWDQIPKNLRKQVDIVEIYAQGLRACGGDEVVERLLGDAIEKNWDEGLVELYGLVEGKDIARQLNRAESWLSEHKQSPALLLALAHICLRSKLWGKARSYLEASIGIAPSAEAHQELGILLEQMGEKDLALKNYRAGLKLISKGPELRTWEYDGRKVKSDLDEESASSDLRRPLDAPIPAAGETS
jgi:HemY protein